MHQLLLIIFLLVLTSSSYAQISPGKLSSSHQHLEGISNCTSCHQLRSEVSREKCLDCHKTIAYNISQNIGFHARDTVQQHNCTQCHSEHHGLDFNLIYWENGKDNFNHNLTDFPLKGKHAALKCASCHKSDFIDQSKFQDPITNDRLNKTFLGLDQSCTSCHFDEHHAQLSTNCATCHSFDNWKPTAGFDHNITNYPLTGKHIQVTCIKCHPLIERPIFEQNHLITISDPQFYNKYKNLSYNQCNNCHNDVHQGKLGNKCNTCHVTDGYNIVKTDNFNHSLTSFPLKGKHVSLSCEKCHVQQRKFTPQDYDQCQDCHTDHHYGQFTSRTDGGACNACHTDDGFKPSSYNLTQHQNSAFPLEGSHLATPCIACHKTENVSLKQDNTTVSQPIMKFRFENKTCQACHTDPHQGQLDKWIAQGGCNYCHNTVSWNTTTFDHSLAQFPLEGKHRSTACLKCHEIRNVGTPNEVIWIKPLSTECNSCHTDNHYGQFTADNITNCASCHTPNAWRETNFDHNTQSRFKLDGAHIKVSCSKCHFPELTNDGNSFIKYKPLGTECADCHKSKS